MSTLIITYWGIDRAITATVLDLKGKIDFTVTICNAASRYLKKVKIVPEFIPESNGVTNYSFNLAKEMPQKCDIQSRFSFKR